jgi:glyoxylase-like metal-dependent hydrolase (beta-lactamase superfamily II)
MQPTVTSPPSRHLEIEALMRAVRWPRPRPQTVLVLAGLLMAARRYEDGYRYFQERIEAEPGQALYEALAAVFQVGIGRDLDLAVARLDAAVEREPGLSNYLRGLVLADLPGGAGRVDTVVSDLEFVIAAKDHFPAGLVRAARKVLAGVYAAAGRNEDAEAALELSGYAKTADDVPVLAIDWAVTARDGGSFASPRITRPAPNVYLAQGFDFSDFAFVETSAGIVAIDSGSNRRHARTALGELRTITTEPITHVILTHAHWDHIGGLEALWDESAGDVEVIAQANFADELSVQNSVPIVSPSFLSEGETQYQDVTPDRLVTDRYTLDVGGEIFHLYPTSGGETRDGLLVHLPSQGVVFAGDMIMPYLGAPFLPEGSADGLFDAMELTQALNPRLLIHGHAPLTEQFTIGVLPTLAVALRDLHQVVVTGIRDGRALVEILHLNHLPGVLRDDPDAVLPYLVIRDNFIQRVHHQRTGYWKTGGEGIEVFSPADWAGALDLLAGGREDSFTGTAQRILDSGDEALALKIADLGLLSHPHSAALAALRRTILLRLVERHQQLNPFKFLYYAGLTGIELHPVR